MRDLGPVGIDGSALATEPDEDAAPRLISDSSTEQAPSARTSAFAVHVADIRKRIHSNTCFLSARLEDAVRRRLGLPPMSAAAAVLAGVLGFAGRLAVPVAVTAVVGQWAGIPWWRWVLVAGVLGGLDAASMWRHAPIDAPSRTGPRQLAEDMTALVPTMERESDIKELAEFTRRWYRLQVSAGVGVAVAIVLLAACQLFAPGALGALPVGSVALLGLLLYDFGEVSSWNVFGWPFLIREARYDHQLFWRNPVDSTEIQSTMRAWAMMQMVLGLSITAYVALGVALVSWSSPLIVPLAVGFVVIGYFTTFTTMLGLRISVRRIVQRIRRRNLLALQSLIDPYETSLTGITSAEAERLERLVSLYDAIGNTSTSPKRTRTLLPAVAAVIIPTIMFVLTVFGEVYAERILDQILP